MTCYRLYRYLISNKIKEFVQALPVSLQLYGCTSWTLTKSLQKNVEQHKDTISHFEQILEATPHKTAGIRLFISHLINHLRKMNNKCWALIEKQGQKYNQSSSVGSSTWTHQSAHDQNSTFISYEWKLDDV